MAWELARSSGVLYRPAQNIHRGLLRVSEPITSVFVYGTLKSGQCRDHYWPATPISIDRAWVHGILYGRDDYPALVIGDERVAGELWRFDLQSIPAVLKTLDRIEGTDQPGEPNLYDRVKTTATTIPEGHKLVVFTYHYARLPQSDGFHRLTANDEGLIVWP